MLFLLFCLYLIIPPPFLSALSLSSSSLSALTQVVCSGLAQMWAGSFVALGPQPLKHSSGRLHQKPGPALLMQICSHTQTEYPRVSGPWNNFFPAQRHPHCTTQVLRTQLRKTTKHSPSPPWPSGLPWFCYFWLMLGHMSLQSVSCACLIKATSKQAWKRRQYLLGSILAACHECVSEQ